MKKTIVIKFKSLPNGQLAVTVTVSKGVVKDQIISVLDVVKEAVSKVDIQKDKS